MRIEFIGVKTKVITSKDQDIVSVILQSLGKNGLSLVDEDVLIIASKIISTIERCQIRISDIKNIRKEAVTSAKISKLSPEFVEIVYREADEVIGAVPGAVLALKDGVLQANAGVDHSNSGGEEFLITLPKNSIKSAEKIRKDIESRLSIKIGVIISDSKEALMATVFEENRIEGAWSVNKGFVTLAEDYVKHDIYIMKIVQRFDSQLIDRFGENYVKLRDIFQNEEARK